MARPSSIDRLPDEIRELIGRLRRQGRTIDEIRTALAELDVDIPRSTLGRHTQELDELAAMLTESQGMAKALLNRLDADPDAAGATGRLNTQLGQAVMFRLLTAAQGGQIQIDGKEAMFITGALRNLASAEKATTDQILRLRREAEAERKRAVDAERAAAAERAATAGADLGWSAEVADTIKRHILGLA